MERWLVEQRVAVYCCKVIKRTGTAAREREGDKSSGKSVINRYPLGAIIISAAPETVRKLALARATRA